MRDELVSEVFKSDTHLESTASATVPRSPSSCFHFHPRIYFIVTYFMLYHRTAASNVLDDYYHEIYKEQGLSQVSYRPPYTAAGTSRQSCTDTPIESSFLYNPLHRVGIDEDD